MSGKTWLLEEPSIEEILGDPIVRLLMDRDGVSENGLRAAIDSAERSRLGDLAPQPEPKVA